MNKVPKSSGKRRPGITVFVSRGCSRVCSTMGDGFCCAFAARLTANNAKKKAAKLAILNGFNRTPANRFSMAGKRRHSVAQATAKSSTCAAAQDQSELGGSPPTAGQSRHRLRQPYPQSTTIAHILAVEAHPVFYPCQLSEFRFQPAALASHAALRLSRLCAP